MKNINELRNKLSEVFEDLRNGNLKTAEAAELNNTAGKIINSTKVELEYYVLRKESPNIKFLSE